MILRKKQILGQIYAILAGILFGSLGFLTIKSSNINISVSTALFWRFFIASIILVPFLLKNSEIQLSKKNLKIALLTSVILNGPTIFFYFMETNRIGISFATIIFFLSPIFVALFAWLTKRETLNKRTLIALSTIIFGMLFLYDRNHSANLFTALLALVASIAYGICIFANKKYSDEICICNSMFIICFGSAMYFLGISLLRGKFLIPYDIYTFTNIIFSSILFTLLPIFMLFRAIQYINVIHLSILLLSEPLFSIALGALGFDESINLKQSIAVAIILSAAMICQPKPDEQELVK